MVYAVDLVSDFETLGFEQHEFLSLVKYFESWKRKEKKQIALDKYDGKMTNREMLASSEIGDRWINDYKKNEVKI